MGLFFDSLWHLFDTLHKVSGGIEMNEGLYGMHLWVTFSSMVDIAPHRILVRCIYCPVSALQNPITNHRECVFLRLQKYICFICMVEVVW